MGTARVGAARVGTTRACRTCSYCSINFTNDDGDTSFGGSTDDSDSVIIDKPPEVLYYLVCNEGDYYFDLNDASTM